MTDRDALLAAVAARPADDTPRLVFADWLDDTGQPDRAAFVRAQCAAARARPGSRTRAGHLDEADDRLAAGEVTWLGSLRDGLRDWEFRRGFLYRVRMSAADFLRHGEELFRAEPVYRLEVTGNDGWELADEAAVQAVVTHPAFAHVRDCAVVTRFFAVPVATWLRSLAANPRLTRLRRFGPLTRFPGLPRPGTGGEGYHLTEPALRAFCAAEHLRGLRSLDLSSEVTSRRAGGGRPWVVPAVAAAPFAPRLRQLILQSVGLTPACFAQLAGTDRFAAVRTLDLSGNTPGPAGWGQVFGSPHLGAVRALVVSGHAVPTLARSPMAARLRGLTVGWSDGGGEALAAGWRELIDAMPPPRLLAFRIHNPGRAVFRAMREAGWLRNLRELDVAGDSQGDVYHNPSGLRPLFRPGVMPCLARLRLHEASDERTLDALAEWPGLGRLESLAVTDDYLGRLDFDSFDPRYPPERARTLLGVTLATDAAVERFLGMPGLEAVNRLQLLFTAQPVEESPPTPAAVEQLVRSDRLANVTRLEVFFHDVPELERRVWTLLADPAALPRLNTLHTDAGANPSAPELDGLRRRFAGRLVLS
jgi:uncharacterized protein (TIGR02996 family)